MTSQPKRDHIHTLTVARALTRDLIDALDRRAPDTVQALSVAFVLGEVLDDLDAD